MKSVLILALLLILESKLTRAQSEFILHVKLELDLLILDNISFFSALTVNPGFLNEGQNVTACVTYTTTPSSLTTIVLSTESGDASGGAISKSTNMFQCIKN